MSYQIVTIDGDGIGPEVMTEVEKVAAFMGQAGLASFEFERGLVGGAAYDDTLTRLTASMLHQ